MKKQLKKMMAVVLTTVMALSVPTFTAFAADEHSYETLFPYEKYLEKVEQGYIAPDVSYETLARANQKTFEDLCSSMDNNPNFTLIYESVRYFDPLAVVETLYPGDVFIMEDTLTSSAILGHAAMAVSNTEIANIVGEETVADIVPRSTFDDYYKNQERAVKIYRSNNYNWGVDAALWADKTFRGTKIPYKITMNLTSTSSVYCSKLVYQAYRYGAGFTSLWREENYDIITPYGLPDYIKIGKHGEYDTE